VRAGVPAHAGANRSADKKKNQDKNGKAQNGWAKRELSPLLAGLRMDETAHNGGKGQKRQQAHSPAVG
jgi:hypothetical protein